MNTDLLILVDTHDKEIGVMPKLEAHEKGVLHRAFSIFIFNSKGQFLLQQRAFNKYHSSGLWTNTCCSHPRPGETVEQAADRRLFEEMGIRANMVKLFSFLYTAPVGDSLVENELDHVFAGVCDDIPTFDPVEVAGWRYVDADALFTEVEQYPKRFTEWFKICLNNYQAELLAYQNFV
jgi:isopentenyl-diphosphate delta-isomerase